MSQQNVLRGDGATLFARWREFADGESRATNDYGVIDSFGRE
jgi:hypothetical protein